MTFLYILDRYFFDAYGNYDLYNKLKNLGFIIESNLVIHTSEQLGDGNFGLVHRGIFKNNDVAIKTLKQKGAIFLNYNCYQLFYFC